MTYEDDDGDGKDKSGEALSVPPLVAGPGVGGELGHCTAQLTPGGGRGGGGKKEGREGGREGGRCGAT